MDGTLLTTIDTRTFYQNITAPVLLSMLTSAGSFLRHLNLRGCAQLRSSDLVCLASRTTNLVTLSLEGCPIKDGSSLSSLLLRNPNLKNLDVSGLEGMTDEVAMELADNCPYLEVLDFGWCSRLTGVGLLDIVSFCPRIRRLRLCESIVFSGQQHRDIMLALRDLENLQDLVLNGCRHITDEMLRFYLRGLPSDPGDDEPEICTLPIRHLSLSRIPNLTDMTLRNMAGVTPDLERLELAGNTNGTAFTNAGFTALFPHIPKLTHLDLEDNHLITDAILRDLAHLPIAKSLIHLQLSYCLEITDSGLIKILQHCTHLRNLEVDNTQAGDGMLMEAPRLIARRVSSQASSSAQAPVGLRIVAYDCGSITWVGVSEVLAQNLTLTRLCNASRRDSISSVFERDSYSQPSPIIRLKCTFEWQRLVDAHTRRCLRGEYAAAEQIGLGFSRWMMEEAEEGVWGGHARRRRRRALGLVDAGDDGFIMGVGRRRLRAFSAPSNCLIM
jgi:F-box and leucine-rich repeat protein 2/20